MIGYPDDVWAVALGRTCQWFELGGSLMYIRRGGLKGFLIVTHQLL